MDEGFIDISKIPRLQFEIHNEELKNCIKELYFQFKNQDKKIDKLKKDIDTRPTSANVADLFLEITSYVDIHPTFVKKIPSRTEGTFDNLLQNNANKFGSKIGIYSDVMKLLSDTMEALEKRLESFEHLSKKDINQKVLILQSQLDQFKKAQNKQNRQLGQSITLNMNKYEEQLKEVESKTIWQINDCKSKLADRVNEQFVRDIVRQSETKTVNKIKESLIKNNIDPAVIDKIQDKCSRLEKEMQVKMVEVASRIKEIKDNIELSVPNKKEVNNDKIENEKKFGTLQVSLADLHRKMNSQQVEIKQTREDAASFKTLHGQTAREVVKMSKMLATLKISDDFMKLMDHLDPHKMCDLDNSIANLNQHNLKIERDVQALKRFIEKFREKVEICNLLAPAEQSAKMDKEELNKAIGDVITSNANIKKISSIEGQLYTFKSYGDMINEINKRISRIQKEFDIQGVVYGLKGLEEFIKKEILTMNIKISQLEAQVSEDKKRRPLSSTRKSETKITSSVSVKKLMPVDCISCFQNPIGERTPQRTQIYSKKF